jgi:hypothetical protein
MSLGRLWNTGILLDNDITYIMVISVADPDPGSGAFFTPGSGSMMGKKIKIRIRELRNNFFN